MQIAIRLLASYRRFLPDDHDDHDDQAGYSQEVSPGSQVGDVLTGLPIPPSESYTFLVNGRHAAREQVLQAGDVLSVFPAIGGG